MEVLHGSRQSQLLAKASKTPGLKVLANNFWGWFTHKDHLKLPTFSLRENKCENLSSELSANP